MTFNLTPKARTPSYDSRTAFRQQSPYARPPSSARSSSSLPSHLSSDSPAFSTTKKGSAGAASRVKAELYDKLSDFGKETEEASADRTRRYVARMNYAIRDKEISLQRDEIHFGRENAEAEFRRQEGLKKLEIELKQAEENAYSKQIEALQLQVRLAELQSSKQPSLSSGPLSFN